MKRMDSKPTSAWLLSLGLAGLICAGCGSSSGDPNRDVDAGPADSDGDGIADAVDNCPDDANPGQEDTDGDGMADACDNCPSHALTDDTDGDGIGDACDDEIVDSATALIVPAGTTLMKSGTSCYEDVIVRGTLAVDGAGALVLVADDITVEAGGVIDAASAGGLGGATATSLGGHMGAGPGAACGGGPGGSVGQAGTGGSYAGVGGQPAGSYAGVCDACDSPTGVSHCLGDAAAVVGTDDGADAQAGSGGSAAGNTSGCMDAGGRGGAGGGAVSLIAANAVVVDGDILADGETPPNDVAECGYRAGGGGGSGGSILIAASSISGVGLLSADGGAGGDSDGDQDDSDWAWGGGGGGGGRLKLFSADNQFAGTSSVVGGLGGVPADPMDTNSDTGLPGGDGVMFTEAAIPSGLDDSLCVP